MLHCDVISSPKMYFSSTFKNESRNCITNLIIFIFLYFYIKNKLSDILIIVNQLIKKWYRFIKRLENIQKCILKIFIIKILI